MVLSEELSVGNSLCQAEEGFWDLPYAQDLDALRGKRTCSHDSSSHPDTPRSASSQSFRTTATDDFTAAAKRMMAGDHPSHQCWACAAKVSHHCHVIAKEDSQAEKWEQAGVLPLNFSRGAATNGIRLCALCHEAYDKAIDPEFVFFPTDLEYFINFERDDKEKRDAATEGKPTRTIPRVSDYRLHQERTGAIPAGCRGGLYRRVFLGQYVSPKTDLSDFPPKTWHGEPMFAIRRAIALLGTAQIRLLPSDIQDQLRTLHQLYFIDDPQGYRDDYLSAINALHGPTEDNHSDRHSARQRGPHGDPNSPSKRPGTDHQGNDGGNGPSPAKRQRGEFELTMRPGQFEEALRQPLDQYGEANGWILGPDSTAEDAVRKLSSIFSQA